MFIKRIVVPDYVFHLVYETIEINLLRYIESAYSYNTSLNKCPL